MDVSPVSFPKRLGSMDIIFNAMERIRISPNLTWLEGKALAERQLMDTLKDRNTVNFLMQNFKKLKTTGEYDNNSNN